LSIIVSVFFVSQGVIQNFDGYKEVSTVTATTYDNPKVDASGNPIKDAQGNPVTEKATTQTQTLPMGPVASQEAIKMLGTNGGGFFNANSAHPYENPTPLTNYFQMFLILLIPGALAYTFGKMVGDTRQGWAIFAAFCVMSLAGVFVSYHYEQRGNPLLEKLGLETAATSRQSGGNMEGKETRFGIVNSALFATVTTNASCGAVNSWHDSFTPLAGLVPLFNIMTGEVIFGGVGAGLYGIILYCIIAVFIAGLMVGRTPEYLGKKIEQKEVKMAMLAIVATAASILVFTGISAVAQFHSNGYWNPPGEAIANRNNSGPHGLAEILYAYVSGTGNNGSAFGGLNANTPWYNLTIGMAMLIGRFLFLIPLLAAAGNLAAKKKVPVTSGTFPTHGPLFVGLLVGTVIIVGALTFFPVLSLGPLVEHYLMHSGKVFSMILLPFGS
jgi:K+-transporting ATPase ATPase A chain